MTCKSCGVTPHASWCAWATVAPVAPIMRAATRDESITRWVADIFTHAKNVVQSYEGREAAKVVSPLNLGVVGTP